MSDPQREADKMEALLERISESIRALPNGPYLSPDDLLSILRRELLPLLRAGQAMRESSGVCGNTILWSNWDAAFQRALEGEKP